MKINNNDYLELLSYYSSIDGPSKVKEIEVWFSSLLQNVKYYGVDRLLTGNQTREVKGPLNWTTVKPSRAMKCLAASTQSLQGPYEGKKNDVIVLLGYILADLKISNEEKKLLCKRLYNTERKRRRNLYDKVRMGKVSDEEKTAAKILRNKRDREHRQRLPEEERFDSMDWRNKKDRERHANRTSKERAHLREKNKIAVRKYRASLSTSRKEDINNFRNMRKPHDYVYRPYRRFYTADSANCVDNAEQAA